MRNTLLSLFLVAMGAGLGYAYALGQDKPAPVPYLVNVGLYCENEAVRLHAVPQAER